MQACSLCSCHVKEAQPSDSQKVPWRSRAEQAASSQTCPSEDRCFQGKEVFLSAQLPLVPDLGLPVRWPHREGSSMFQIWVGAFL